MIDSIVNNSHNLVGTPRVKREESPSWIPA